jgi:parvulin-like peptidyl-prolyl isomerase
VSVPTGRAGQPDKAIRRKRKGPQRGVPSVIQQREQKPLIFGWGAHLNRHEREHIKERIALAIGIALALVLAAVIGYGWYQDHVVTPNNLAAAKRKPLARVGSQVITTDFFKRFQQFQANQINNQISQVQQRISQDQALGKAKAAEVSQLQQYQSQLQNQLSGLAQNSLNVLIDDDTILQRAGSAGVFATKKQVDAQMTQLERNLGGRIHLQQFIAQSGLTADEIRQQVTADYLRGKLQKKLAAQTPHYQYQVRASHVLIPSSKKSLAEKVYHQALAGANFAALAKKYSIDTSSAKKGGDVGYFGRGVMVAPFENATFSMKVGQIRLVKSTFGWHIIKLTGRRRYHLNAKQYSQAQQNALNSWLLKEQSVVGVYRYVKAQNLPGIATATSVAGASNQAPVQIPQSTTQPQPNPATKKVTGKK